MIPRNSTARLFRKIRNIFTATLLPIDLRHEKRGLMIRAVCTADGVYFMPSLNIHYFNIYSGVNNHYLLFNEAFRVLCLLKRDYIIIVDKKRRLRASVAARQSMLARRDLAKSMDDAD